MQRLAAYSCEACEAGAPTVADDERATLKAQVPDWDIREVDGVERLEREFSFSDFVEALAFTNRVGELAESEGHHPAILTEWGRVTVGWWTHKIGGLHRNDFVMSAKTDDLFADRG